MFSHEAAAYEVRALARAPVQDISHECSHGRFRDPALFHVRDILRALMRDIDRGLSTVHAHVQVPALGRAPALVRCIVLTWIHVVGIARERGHDQDLARGRAQFPAHAR